jgi:hypothetical protein
MDEKVGRNDPCPCGSGLKFKKCCFGKPPKLKFTAKVIKSKSVESGLQDKLNAITNQKSEAESQFKMTSKDFRVTKK